MPLRTRRDFGRAFAAVAAGLALFGMANVPFVYISVNYWRTIHPATSVVPTLGPGMLGPFWFSVAAFMILGGLLMAVRLRLEERRAALDRLYQALED